jgi:hypothetical protein
LQAHAASLHGYNAAIDSIAPLFSLVGMIHPAVRQWSIKYNPAAIASHYAPQFSYSARAKA